MRIEESRDFCCCHNTQDRTQHHKHKDTGPQVLRTRLLQKGFPVEAMCHHSRAYTQDERHHEGYHSINELLPHEIGIHLLDGGSHLVSQDRQEIECFVNRFVHVLSSLNCYSPALGALRIRSTSLFNTVNGASVSTSKVNTTFLGFMASPFPSRHGTMLSLFHVPPPTRPRRPAGRQCQWGREK